MKAGSLTTSVGPLQISVALGVGLCAFVVWPTVVDQFYLYNPLQLLFGRRSQDMQLLRRKKRIGRYTVGLTNRANDCFANSNLQALAALRGLYSYLIQIGFLVPEDIKGDVKEDVDLTEDEKDVKGDVKSNKAPPPSPKGYARLSKALQEMVAELNEPVLAPTCISPWTLLGVLEVIYKSRISRSQHDAHELLHLILETLQNENDALATARKDERFQVPEFPFKGSTIDRISCSKCGYSPPVTPSTFLVLSLMVPQKRSVSLTWLLDSLSNPEFIQDYGCANCKLQYALRNSHTLDPQIKQELAKYADSPDKLPEALEKMLPKEITSPIAKSTRFHTLPSALVIHLSRSIYGGYGASRNSCKVSVVEHLELFESNGPGPLDKKKVKYTLAAMIRHKGTHQTGHYECFRRKNLIWWREVVGTRMGPFNVFKPSSYVEGDVQQPPPIIVNTNVDNTVESENSHTATPPPPLASNLSSSPTSSSSSPPSSPSSSTQSSAFSPFDTDVRVYGANEIRGLKPNLPFAISSPSPASVSLYEISNTIHGSSPRAGTSSPGPPGVLPASHLEWWKVSDDKVWECSTRDVLKEESGAYLLFYERVP